MGPPDQRGKRSNSLQILNVHLKRFLAQDDALYLIDLKIDDYLYDPEEFLLFSIMKEYRFFSKTFREFWAEFSKNHLQQLNIDSHLLDEFLIIKKKSALIRIIIAKATRPLIFSTIGLSISKKMHSAASRTYSPNLIKKNFWPRLAFVSRYSTKVGLT